LHLDEKSAPCVASLWWSLGFSVMRCSTSESCTRACEQEGARLVRQPGGHNLPVSAPDLCPNACTSARVCAEASGQSQREEKGVAACPYTARVLSDTTYDGGFTLSTCFVLKGRAE
jgi:hypothetical protein